MNTAILLMPLWALAGGAAGWLFFRLLAFSVRRLGAGGGALPVLGLMAARFGLLILVMLAAAKAGPGALVMALLGFLASRWRVRPEWADHSSGQVLP